MNKEIIYDSSKLNDGCGCLNAILQLSYLQDYQKDNTKALIENLNRLKDAKGTSIASIILFNIKYEDYLEKNAKTLGYSLDNLSNIITTFKIITEDCINVEDVFNKLAKLNNLMKQPSNNGTENAVSLTSMHGAKGLEWKNVFIMSMVEGTFPSSQSIVKSNEGDNSLLEEVRRLCYVALTRGKSYVDLLVPKKKNNIYTSPSMFIKEINNIMAGNDPNELDGKSSNNIAHDVTFSEGEEVQHKVFGVGKVMSIDTKNDIIIVMFKEKGIKRLMYSLSCGGILKKYN